MTKQKEIAQQDDANESRPRSDTGVGRVGGAPTGRPCLGCLDCGSPQATKADRAAPATVAKLSKAAKRKS